jgi:hypothetical protein
LIVALSFLLTETARGAWECRHEDHVLGEYPSLAAALEHLRSLAQARDEAFTVAMRHHDGWIRQATGTGA